MKSPFGEKETIDTLVQGVLQGDVQAVARAIRLVESDGSSAAAAALLERIWPRVGRAQRIGITGPPGAGKSTFTNQLVKAIRASHRSVGIIAVDPSSAVSGGAIFGDRLRMEAVDTDPGVFIRSMATRGNLGGLALRAAEAADILDAAGKEIVIFETVGSGQTELDIMDAADTVVLLSTPGTGDMVQAMKAGIMEAGDIFVVNKADLEGAELAKADIQAVLGMRRTNTNAWQPPVLLVNSIAGSGVTKVLAQIEKHWHYLQADERLNQKRKKWIEKRVRMLINAELKARFWTPEKRRRLIQQVGGAQDKSPSPEKIARQILSSEISD